MSPANNTKVLIGGNVYTLSGEESEEYIQRVALYINNKLDEIQQTENAKQLNTRLLSVLLDINIADDYFKAKETINELTQLIDSKDKTIETLNKENESLLKNKADMHDEITKLKTQIDGLKAELNEYLEMFDEK